MLKSLLVRHFPRSLGARLYPPREMAWIVHPRDFADITKKFWMLQILPKIAATWLFKHSWPFVLSTFGSTKNDSLGYVIATPLVPEQFNTHPHLAKKKLREALELAEKLGAKKISIAGFLSSVMQKNKLAVGLGVSVFDGTTLMPQLAVAKLKLLMQERRATGRPTVGVIGATTYVGQAVSRLISSGIGVERLVLLGRTQGNLDALAESCQNTNPKLKVWASTDWNQLAACDFVLLTAYIDGDQSPIEKYLKSDAIFLGVVEPISPFVWRLKKVRSDIKIIAGMVMETPDVWYDTGRYNFGLPPKSSFVCLAEAMVLDKPGQQTNTKELSNKFGYHPIFQ